MLAINLAMRSMIGPPMLALGEGLGTRLHASLSEGDIHCLASIGGGLGTRLTRLHTSLAKGDIHFLASSGGSHHSLQYTKPCYTTLHIKHTTVSASAIPLEYYT